MAGGPDRRPARAVPLAAPDRGGDRGRPGGGRLSDRPASHRLPATPAGGRPVGRCFRARRLLLPAPRHVQPQPEPLHRHRDVAVLGHAVPPCPRAPRRADPVAAPAEPVPGRPRDLAVDPARGALRREGRAGHRCHVPRHADRWFGGASLGRSADATVRAVVQGSAVPRAGLSVGDAVRPRSPGRLRVRADRSRCASLPLVHQRTAAGGPPRLPRLPALRGHRVDAHARADRSHRLDGAAPVRRGHLGDGFRGRGLRSGGVDVRHRGGCLEHRAPAPTGRVDQRRRRDACLGAAR